MSETKWTPGPWDLIQHGERDSRVGAKTLIAIVYSQAFHDRENQEANAHLIAAAPDLYRALEALYNHDAGGGEYWLSYEIAQMCRVALAKARGESQ